ncbi:MAG: diguanylate cyclase [Thermodesulfobacteriota bacterium]
MVSRFLQLNIAQKMYLGILPLLVLIVFISIFALVKLNQLTSLNQSIMGVNIPAQEDVKKMREIAIDQESIIRRFMILKDEEFLKVFNDKGSQFLTTFNKFTSYADELDIPFDDLEEAYTSYSSTLLTGIKVLDDSPKKLEEFEQTIRVGQTELLNILSSASAIAEWDQNEKAAASASIGSMAFKFALGLCVIGIFMSAAGAALVARNIIGAIKKLHLATEMISQGNFDYRPEIDNKDELGDLADAFVSMAERLKNLEEMYLDSSPLTRMPGGLAIENMLKKRIDERKLFAFCLMDIDNFKSFNDHYGYAKGNEMIQETASIIEQTIATKGSDEDFIGHIGGDDFVLLTTPDKYKMMCRTVIEEFDERTPAYYVKEDRERGFIVGENRQGQKVTFPLASISIAVVTNQHRILNNHIQVGEIAAEIKEHSKSIAGSSMVVDQRQGPEFEAERDGKLINFPSKGK